LRSSALSSSEHFAICLPLFPLGTTPFYFQIPGAKHSQVGVSGVASFSLHLKKKEKKKKKKTQQQPQNKQNEIRNSAEGHGMVLPPHLQPSPPVKTHSTPLHVILSHTVCWCLLASIYTKALAE